MRAIMLRLVGEGEGEAAVRRRAPLTELDLERNRDIESVLGTLADSRLVTVSEGSVEVAHEALLREWPRLASGSRRTGRAGACAATSPRPPPNGTAGRDRGELYRGARLAAASTGAPTTPSSSTSSNAPSSPRAARHPRRRPSASARRTAGSAACSSASPSCWRPPSRAASSRSPSAAKHGTRRTRRATPRPPSSPSASARRRSSRGPRPLAAARPPSGRNRRLAADPWLPARRPPARPRCAGIMHGRREAPAGIALHPDGKSLAVDDFFGKLAPSSTPGHTRRSASHSRSSHPSRVSPTAPTEKHSLWRKLPAPHRREDARGAGAGVRGRNRGRPHCLHRGRVAARRPERRHHAPRRSHPGAGR